ncbi:MAG: hypothetical protein ACE5GC_01345 [Acidimicrobiia bacterium]
MIHLRVERSPVRQFLLGIAGLVLLIAALDIVRFHWLSGPPATNDEGVVTSRGIVDRREDVLWGTVLAVGGGVALLAAVAGLAVRRPMVELTEDELRVRLGGPLRTGGPMAVSSVPWEEVLSVRSATEERDGWPRSRVLVIHVTDLSRFPEEPWGAQWEQGALHMDADGWQVPAEEVALRAQLLVGRKGRSGQGGEPGT